MAAAREMAASLSSQRRPARAPAALAAFAGWLNWRSLAAKRKRGGDSAYGGRVSASLYSATLAAASRRGVAGGNAARRPAAAAAMASARRRGAALWYALAALALVAGGGLMSGFERARRVSVNGWRGDIVARYQRREPDMGAFAAHRGDGGGGALSAACCGCIGARQPATCRRTGTTRARGDGMAVAAAFGGGRYQAAKQTSGHRRGSAAGDNLRGASGRVAPSKKRAASGGGALRAKAQAI